MKLEQRIEKLEDHLIKTKLDPYLDGELTKWFKSNPDYHPLTQPENNNGVDMPDNLNNVFKCRLEYVFYKKNLKLCMSNLVNVWGELYP